MNTVLRNAHRVLVSYANHCEEIGQPILPKAVNTIRLLKNLRYTPREGGGGPCETIRVTTSPEACPIPQARGKQLHFEALAPPPDFVQAFATEEKIMRDLERFRQKIKYNPETGCDEWTGRIHKSGYAEFSVGGRTVRAARWLYGVTVGPIPPGLELSHACHCRKCVRLTLPGAGGRRRTKTDRKSSYRTEHGIIESHKDNSARSAREKVWSGSRNGNAKLLDAEVKLMRELYETGGPETTPAQLARDFEVSLRTVHYILAYERYEDAIPNRCQARWPDGRFLLKYERNHSR